jgi:hypothetical protein
VKLPSALLCSWPLCRFGEGRPACPGITLSLNPVNLLPNINR